MAVLKVHKQEEQNNDMHVGCIPTAFHRNYGKDVGMHAPCISLFNYYYSLVCVLFTPPSLYLLLHFFYSCSNIIMHA